MLEAPVWVDRARRRPTSRAAAHGSSCLFADRNKGVLEQPNEVRVAGRAPPRERAAVRERCPSQAVRRRDRLRDRRRLTEIPLCIGGLAGSHLRSPPAPEEIAPQPRVARTTEIRELQGPAERPGGP